MTPRELITAVLDHADPPRIGMSLPAPHPNDLIGGKRAGRETKPVEPRGQELRRWVDEWGVTWASLTEFDKGEVVAGAIEDWGDLDDYQPPDLGRAEDYRAAAEQFAKTDKFRIGYLPGFTFSVARKLRKLDRYLCDLVLAREPVDRLHERVRAELLKGVDQWAAAGADAIYFAEDWGMQDRLLISPAMWREIFRPEFETLGRRIQDHGLRLIMHSCGKNTAILPDCIDCGVDCFQFDQPRLHGLDALAELHGLGASFWCPVDIQQTLQSGDPDAIVADAREMIETLGAGGGFIAGHYTPPEAIGITPEIQEHANRAFVEFAAAAGGST